MLLAHKFNFILWLPVSFVSTKQPFKIVAHTSGKGVAKQFIALFKILIGCLIPEYQIVVVALKPKDKESNDRTKHYQEDGGVLLRGHQTLGLCLIYAFLALPEA